MRVLAIRVVIIIAMIVGGRALIEHYAEKRMVVASQMYEDGEYDSPLRTLRSLNRWLSWTEAYRRDGEDLTEKVRQRRVELKQRREEEARDRAFDQQWERERREEEKRLEEERRIEEEERRIEAYREAQRQAREDMEARRSGRDYE